MIITRAETPVDYAAVRRVHELAFGRPEEADLVERLRATADPLISLVAVREGGVAGHLLFSPVTREAGQCPEPGQSSLFGLAPVAVLPEWQHQGIGSQLIREGLRVCQLRGVAAVVVLGHPEYYPRFGFVPASRFGLRCEYPVPDDVFMALELKPGALSAPGLIRYHAAFAGV